jgi:NAD(P)H-hydrate epimerase
MQKVVTTAQMREIDRLTTEKYGISSLQLMENAAQSVVDVIHEVYEEVTAHHFLIVCGPGNNGGDGAAIARLLADECARVTLVLVKNLAETKGDARINLEKFKDLTGGSSGFLSFFECPDESSWMDFVTQHRGIEPDLIIDALFGTGLTRPLTSVFAAAVDFINDVYPNDPLIISVDMPSGLNSDDHGVPERNVIADLTVSFTAPKVANSLVPASRCGGELVITQIGSPPEFVDEAESKLFLTDETDAVDFLLSTPYLPGSFKNSHGHALIIAGSRDYLGAPVLCGDAAMQSGAGLVTVATPASALFGVAPRLMPEIITATLAETDSGAVSFEARHQVEKLARRATVIAVGPGLTSGDQETKEFVRWLVENRRQPLIIDADGLNALAPWPAELRGSEQLPIILTPHPGEMRRLLGVDDLGTKPWETAAAFAEKQHLIVVLKGERTVVIAPNGEIFINPTGNPGVGTAGAGDTMTGVIASFVAQDAALQHDPSDDAYEVNFVQDVLAAVYICGLAADLAAAKSGMRAMTASDIRMHLSAAMLELDPHGERP